MVVDDLRVAGLRRDDARDRAGHVDGGEEAHHHQRAANDSILAAQTGAQLAERLVLDRGAPGRRFGGAVAEAQDRGGEAQRRDPAGPEGAHA